MHGITGPGPSRIRPLATWVIAGLGVLFSGSPSAAQQLRTDGPQTPLADKVGDQSPNTDAMAGSQQSVPLAQVPIFEIGPVDLRRVEEEDETRRGQNLPPRFAIPHPVMLTPATAGLWRTLPDGQRQWRLRISAPDARSINLGFGRYRMPAGGRLHLYASDGTSRIRPFTENDNQDHGQLWTPIIPSDDIVIELVLPNETAVDSLDLELTSINYGYRGFGTRPATDEAAGPRSGWCNVDVVCPEGDLWWDEIPSVAVISLGGGTFCTGFMVNNTANDETPYFMTAEHCGVTSGNAASLVTYWNYQTSVCGGTPNGTFSQFNSGSSWRAGYSVSDFTLVRLNSSPNPDWGITFAGWDRTSSNFSGAIAIHHPSLDEKRISFENQPTTTTSYFGSSSPGNGTHIRVADWDIGTTEPGSSGSPLFSPNHHVIGQLHGGLAACGNNSPDWYGRFSRSWTGGGSSSNRLSNWLDPISTGQTTLDTLVPGAVCGNGVIEEGETCDDGGTIPGDGCDEFCQIEYGPADECNECIPIGDGPFIRTTADNTGAADDTSCTDGDTVDEWYCYTATCTGIATADTCDPTTDYDSALAVFDACGGTELDCNDDAAGAPPACDLGGSNRKSIINWNVTAGSTYYIRVSGFGGATGNYALNVSCTPLGACCFGDSSCSVLTQDDCTSTGGNYQGDNVPCTAGLCPVITGACCDSNGSCVIQMETDCDASGGTYWGDDTTCNPNPCPQPRGACCLTGTTCLFVTPSGCDSFGGTYLGNDVPCDVGACPPTTTGACCHTDGSCTTDTAANCGGAGGTYQGDGIACSPDPCLPSSGACCYDGGSCTEGTPGDCAAAGGTYDGDGTTCTPSPCTQDCPGPVVPGDMDGDDDADGEDIQGFVDALMIQSREAIDVCPADFDGSLIVDMGDIPGMVAALLQ